ncbi:MAG TPA: hypothetical protein VN317_01725 [Candidatus Methanoperedens sp.]|nr:hypothetical protein [Candidatus Methanoperedens sp.]
MLRTRSAGAMLAVLVSLAGCGGAAKIGLPPGFPSDVPVPEGAVLRTARDLGKRGQTVVFESREGVRPLAGRLGERLRAAGWSVMSEAVVDAAVFSSWRKGERSVAFGVSESGGVTLVGISVVERPFNEWEEVRG